MWASVDAPVSQEIYRDGELIATPSNDQTSYADDGLSPNRRYAYRLELDLDGGSSESAEESAATLANPPRVAGPVNVNERGFSLAILDDGNPPETDYLVSVRRREDPASRSIRSEWDASRCRTFDSLVSDTRYVFEVVARNLDGIETTPTRWHYTEDQEKPRIWRTQPQTGPKDQWAVDRINDAADIYGLTERARTWMLSDIRVVALRNEPGHAGFRAPGLVTVGQFASPGTLMHEMMHGFWEHWPDYSDQCDVMNIYTFSRDVALFMLNFRERDESGQSNPWEDWRPFYNALVGNASRHSSLNGESAWEVLERGDFHVLWDVLYHSVDPEIPQLTAGNLSLIPQALRPYFEGFISESEQTNWLDELYWYNGLSHLDRYLWDGVFKYYEVLHHSPEYWQWTPSETTTIPEPLRRHIMKAGRQQLVAFVNTLEDVARWDASGRPLWANDFGFWRDYVSQSMVLVHLYVDEIGADTGVELEEENLNAVKVILRVLARNLYCGTAKGSEVRSLIESSSGISELQRTAFLEIIRAWEETGRDICYLFDE